MRTISVFSTSLFIVGLLASCSGSVQDTDLIAGKYVDESSLQLSDSELKMTSDQIAEDIMGKIILTNNGSASLVLTSIEVIGSGYSFAESTSTCTVSMILEETKGCYIDVSFLPEKYDQFSGQVNIVYQNESGSRQFQKSVNLVANISAGDGDSGSALDENGELNLHLNNFAAKFNKIGVGIVEWELGKKAVHAFKLSYLEGDTAPENCDGGTEVAVESGKSSYSYFYKNFDKVGLYSFRICALDDQGVVRDALTASADRLKPEYVEELSAKLLSKSSVQLTWTSDFEPPLFRIAYNNSAIAPVDCITSFNTTIIDNVTATSKTISDLSLLGNYSFRVCGIISSGKYSQGKIVNISNKGPIPVITGPISGYATTSSFPVTIDFGERVTGFSKSKITVTGGTVSSLTQSGSSYTATIAASSDGDVGISLATGAAKGYGGELSQAATLTVTADTQAPTVSFNSLDSTTNSSTVAVIISFSEAVKNFSLSDIVVSGASITDFVHAGLTTTLNLTSMTEGTVSLSIPASSFFDLAGNINADAASTSFTYDVTAPTSPSISISSGAAATASSKVTLGLSATGAQDVYVTNTAGCGSGGYWDTYSTVYAWTLGATDQTVSVYVKFRDAAGNMTSCVSDDIIMDTVNPAAASSPSASFVDTGVSYSFTAATDTLSGIADYQIAIGTTSGGTETLSYTNIGSTATSGTYTVSLSLTIDTTYYISFKAVDNAGNASSAVVASAVYSWKQQAYIKPDNLAASDLFGVSLAISNDTIVVGATGEDSNQTTITNGSTSSSDNSASGSGAAYIFVRSGTSWSQQAYLKPPYTGSSDYYGGSVAISGDTAVVAAKYEDSNQVTITNGSTASSNNSTTNSGAIYVYTRSGTSWSQEAFIKPSNGNANDYFGYETSIDGNTIVVSSYYEDSNQTTITNGTTSSSNNSSSGSGASYVFVRSGTSWSQEAYLKAPNASSSDYFGSDVSVSGNTIVVGAWGEDSNQSTITNGSTASSDNSASSSGAAYVFVRSGTSWSQEAYLKTPNPDAGDVFGMRVAVDSNTIVVSARNERNCGDAIVNGSTASTNNSCSDTGAAYVFVRSGTSWSQEAYLKASNSGSSDYFGTGVSVSGNTIAVTAHMEDGTAANAGAAYIFVRSGTSWSQEAYIKAGNPSSNDYLGDNNVAISGTTLVVGAHLEDSNQTTITNGETSSSDDSASSAGAVYVYKK